MTMMHLVQNKPQRAVLHLSMPIPLALPTHLPIPDPCFVCSSGSNWDSMYEGSWWNSKPEPSGHNQNGPGVSLSALRRAGSGTGERLT